MHKAIRAILLCINEAKVKTKPLIILYLVSRIRKTKRPDLLADILTLVVTSVNSRRLKTILCVYHLENIVKEWNVMREELEHLDYLSLMSLFLGTFSSVDGLGPGRE
jgi:hypothetical protein